MMRRSWPFTVPIIVALTVTGCVASGGDSMSGVNEDLTLDEAKQSAMSVERDIAALIPSEFVASVEQRQHGVLLSCDDDRGYQWTGHTDVIVQGDPNPAAIVDAVVGEYETRESFAANVETTADGHPSAHVRGEYGAGYLVTESVDHTAIEILSFSPCFRLPEDMWAGGTY